MSQGSLGLPNASRPSWVCTRNVVIAVWLKVQGGHISEESQEGLVISNR